MLGCLAAWMDGVVGMSGWLEGWNLGRFEGWKVRRIDGSKVRRFEGSKGAEQNAGVLWNGSKAPTRHGGVDYAL